MANEEMKVILCNSRQSGKTLTAKIYASLVKGEHTRLELSEKLGVSMPTIRKRLIDGRWGKLELAELKRIFK